MQEYDACFLDQTKSNPNIKWVIEMRYLQKKYSTLLCKCQVCYSNSCLKGFHCWDLEIGQDLHMWVDIL